MHVSPELIQAARSMRTESDVLLKRLLGQIESSRDSLLRRRPFLSDIEFAGAACAELGKIILAKDAYDRAMGLS